MADMTSLFLQDTFTFHVGPKKTVVKIPPVLLSKHSAPLYAMISNGMKESKKKVAVLPDEDPETLNCFLEWALGGVYRVKEIQHNKAKTKDNDVEEQYPGNVSHFYCNTCRKHASKPLQINVEAWCTNCQVSTPQCSKCRRAVTTRTAHEISCQNRGCLTTNEIEPWKVGNGIRSRVHLVGKLIGQEWPVGSYSHGDVRAFLNNVIPKVSMTANLLAHAKVYVFAEKYLIKSLSQLAFHMLSREVVGYSVEQKGSVHLVALIQYAYANLGPSDGNEVDLLKTLVLTRAALSSDQLLRCKAFCKLLHDGGDFTVSFAKMLSNFIF